ncbi:hypothetical protein LWI28_020780 [Acer negundo]|uniref:Bifunctional inhibitor/plant lipid transfer protein/seed storage helical domain-containing protein n=1 Tax=Acer negundo TaxID=4023 RepID=A0AAD5J0W5_ACENE|nr:hypothetical protein LWI28_020780 [Acer negundo]KAK4845399.1 hypothetical protein QYF36_004523 [Acer negundo]
MRASSRVATLLVVLVLLVVGVWPAKGDLSPSQCEQEKRLLVNACRAVVFGRKPSPNCCERVRVTHTECVCPSVTPKFAALIGVQRTISQIQGCGRTVPRNFKCGSITTPP